MDLQLRLAALLGDGLWHAGPALALGAMGGQVYRPWVPAPTGAGGFRRRVPMTGRLRLHRLPLLALGLVLAAGTLLGALSAWVAPVAALAAWAILLAPVRYTVTETGIALGRTPARRWTEFAGLRVRRGRVRLTPVVGCAPMTVWVGRARGREDAVLTMRAHIRRAYRPHHLSESAPAKTAPTDDYGIPALA